MTKDAEHFFRYFLATRTRETFRGTQLVAKVGHLATAADGCSKTGNLHDYGVPGSCPWVFVSMC
jgi:hypothetical protein